MGFVNPKCIAEVVVTSGFVEHGAEEFPVGLQNVADVFEPRLNLGKTMKPLFYSDLYPHIHHNYQGNCKHHLSLCRIWGECHCPIRAHRPS